MAVLSFSGRAVELGRLSARSCFGATAGAGLFAAWRFEARLGGILMKNVHYITPTKIKNIDTLKLSGCVPWYLAGFH